MLVSLVLLCAAAAGDGPAVPAPAPDPVEKALAEGREKGRPVFLEFTLASSGWCREMDREVSADPAVAAFRDANFVVCRVDAGAGEGPRLREAWGVDGYPTFVFLSPDGKEAERHVGSLSKEEFLALLEDERAGNTYEALPGKIERSPEDGSLRVAYGRRLLFRNLVPEARREFEKAVALDPEDARPWTPDARLRLALIEAQERHSPAPVLAFLEKYGDSPAGPEAQRQMIRHHLRKKDLAAAMGRMGLLEAKGALGLRQRCQYATLLAVEGKDAAGALAIAEDAARKDPEDVRPRMARAFALSALGRHDEAVEAAREAVGKAPEDLRSEGEGMVRRIEEARDEAKEKGKAAADGAEE